MEQEEYLNEERYQRTKGKISIIGTIFCLFFILLGAGLISLGVYNIIKYNDKEVLKIEENNLLKIKEEIQLKIEPIEQEIKKLEREQFTGFNDEYYVRKDKIEELAKSISEETYTITLISRALDKGFNYCAFDEYQDSEYTKNYCDYRYNNPTKYMIFIIPGIFCLMIGLMLSISLFATLKRREMLAFVTQQTMPIAQEGMEKMAPTLGKVAEEISKGIKNSIK